MVFARGNGKALLLVGALAAVACARGRASEAKSQKPIPARVVMVEARQIRRNVDSVGTLFPFEEVAVSSEVEGRVEMVYVDVGDHVVQGRPLVKVYPLELDLTRERERAALQQACARLGVRDGEDLPDVSQAAEVKRAAADRTDAEQKYLRAKSLFEEGLLSRGNFDEAEARYNSGRAAYDMSVQSVQDARSQIAQHRASLAMAEKKLADAVIRAPFAGQVKERMVAPGQYLKVQTPVMVIVSNDPLRVRLKVPEKMAAWISVGQPVKVSVEAYAGRFFDGTISRINPSVDVQTRAFEVEALLENKDSRLKPGFFARATIVSSQVDTALMVPQGALRYLYGVYKVFTVEGASLKEKEVKLGERSGDDVEIVEGLKEKQKVAVALKEELRDGALVEAVQ